MEFMRFLKERNSRDTAHWMEHATTWSERPGGARTQLCRGYCLPSMKMGWKPLVPLVCHLQGKFQQPQYRTRTSESTVPNSSPLVAICGLERIYDSMPSSVEV